MKKLIGCSIPFLVACVILVVLTNYAQSAHHVLAASTRYNPEGTILVNSLEDELNSDGDCSLREAITAANTNAPSGGCPAGEAVLTDTITFNQAGIITIDSQHLIIAGGPLVIDGGEVIAIDGNYKVRIFEVDAGADLTLDNLILMNGNAGSGGGIYNSGTLVVDNSILYHNDAMDYNLADGGGIYNNGDLSVIDSYFTENTTWGMSGAGGAIYNNGSLEVINSVLEHNVAWYHIGGGLYNNGDLSISYSDITGNSAYHDGGGIFHSNGNMMISYSTISGNGVGYKGGGLFVYAGTITLTNCSLNDNGGLYGGGIYNSNDVDMLISSSLIYGNHASNEGGGIYGQGVLDIINTTVSSNHTDGFGGGISNSMNLYILNSTITGNSAGVEGGGVLSMSSIARNSIFAYNVGSNCTTVADGGHNISSDNSCGFTPANDSMSDTDPLLGPLFDNGGPTLTHALLDGSPAIDAGDDAQCPLTDQRGVSRPRDGNGDGLAVCDIGAFEKTLPVYFPYLPLVFKLQ